jgi:glucans biosynthesis protein
MALTLFVPSLLRSCLCATGFAVSLVSANAAFAFDFDDVAAKAQKLGATSYKKPVKNLTGALEKLSYDQYRDIRYDRSKGPWGDGLPFELAFFHQGMLFDSPVKINEIIGKKAREIRFDSKAFDYGANKLNEKDLAGAGFAGFRVHYPINTPKYKDEVMVFLGASYFRAIGKSQLYGLSARGLAVDTALNSGEEFPRFSEFWIERPAKSAKSLTIYALLDSQRLTGAYRFTIHPGTETTMDVKARLFLRENVTKLGIAPLTSMYLFGENHRAGVDDYRPEVHDSDGLSIQSGTGEWIWRPLVNPKRLMVTSFSLTNPQGFGLMQRDRVFSSYEDLEAHYQQRPSAWIEPKGTWGAGRVELVQIPTPDETNDNIVAYWVPTVPPQPGKPFNFEYLMRWQKDQEARPPLSWVTQTRRGHGYRREADESIALFVDFEGPALKKLAADAKVDAIVTAGESAKVLEVTAYPNAVTGGWRMAIRLMHTDDKRPVELRGYLVNNNNTLSETWSYILPAK